MKYYPCKNKTEFLTLLVMAENNGFVIDMGRFSAKEYADYHWYGQNKFGISHKVVAGYSGDLAKLMFASEISFPEMAAILVNTAQPQITQKDFADYVCGFLCLTEQDPNLKNLSVENMKIALANSANCLDCPNDGIAAYVERRAAQS
jgi:hypothetical protein